MIKNKKIVTLIIFFAVTIIACVYALKWHAVYKDEVLNKAIIADYIQEIKDSELNNYIVENPYAVIYFGIPNDVNCRAFEEKFKQYINEKDLSEKIVYLNISNIDEDNFSNTFDTLYNTKELRDKNKYLYEVPTVAVYDHTKLVDFISAEQLAVDQVERLLNKYNIGEK